MQALYERLAGLDHGHWTYAAALMGNQFASGLFSCAVHKGQHAMIDEGECAWTRIQGGNLNRDARVDNPGADETVYGVSVGAQIGVSQHWRVGGGLGATTSDFFGTAGTTGEATRVHAGVAAKYVDGPMVVGGALSLGYADISTERTTGVGTAEADFDAFDVSARVKAGYLIEQNGVYIKPQIEAGATYVSRSGFTETGAGGANLKVERDEDVYFSVSPSVEVSAEVENGALTMRPYARAGATWLSEDDVTTVTSLAGDASGNTFSTSTAVDDKFADFTLGVAAFSDDSVTVRAEYNGRFADETQIHGGQVKVEFKW